ncbi:DUF6249 domain-containing protein [Tengunoibacter tsumagoiensis]|uniref:DUF6249 domain-containing protein n=1 Tax=Tengunoibacter tsumagoiensis TaxID=2014871 RepID=A0A402A5C4_9CHLR|nr:DUF6249 domain-containing protein [Tengunoibacter tsumagoiensis]GCE14353.1 hypothetical protein KTT_42120 [Tengunoibacter tsumagoiensis]
MSYTIFTIVIGWLIALAFFFGFIVLLRYINHRERMAMIQQGLHPDIVQKRRRSRGMLRAGLITMMVGLTLTIGLYPIGFFLPETIKTPLHLGPWLLPGFIPFGVGAAMVISYYLEQSTHVPTGEDKEKVIPIEEYTDHERRQER